MKKSQWTNFAAVIKKLVTVSILLGFCACGKEIVPEDENVQSFQMIRDTMQQVSPFATSEQMEVVDRVYETVLKDYCSSEDKDAYDTYQLFEKLAASLGEGHAGVFAPEEVLQAMGQLPVRVTYLDGNYYISDAVSSYSQLLYRKVIAIDGVPVSQYLEGEIQPLISMTTPNARQQKAADRLLVAPIGKKITFELEDSGGSRNSYELTYDDAAQAMQYEGLSTLLTKNLSKTQVQYSSSNFVYTKLDGVPYLAIFSFQDPNLYTEFTKNILPLIRQEKQLILDVRSNNGGNGETAKEILFLLTGDETQHYPFLDAKVDLSELEKRSSANEDNQQSELEPCSLSKIVLLTSHTAYSAADDFVFYAKQSPSVTTIGTNTGGATGMVQYFELPNGMTFCCSVIRDYDQAHADITGNGIAPDKLVWQKIEDAKNGQDTALSRALDFLQEK